jgi:hypothetical protein
MTDQGVMALQNCVDLKKDESGGCSKTCPEYSHEGNGDIRIKTEVGSDGEVEDNAVTASLQRIEAECEVSFKSVYPLLGTFHACQLSSY